MVTFDNAPQVFAGLIVERLDTETVGRGRIVRDIYGRLSFVTSAVEDTACAALTEAAARALGVYSAPRDRLIIQWDESDVEGLRQEPSVEVDGPLRMIDRRLAGEDWLSRASKLVDAPKRLVFYSVKGGVGRSTGLAITAADLAARGLNVLVIDLDLEAPGLGSLLLKPDDMPRYGVVDWFAALAVGADVEEMVLDMTGPSPFTSSVATVDVVPAAGKTPGSYLSKLARAYTPGSIANKYAGKSFADKVDLLITKLSERQKYDVVLIDARAGLHETSGSIVLRLGARVLLFGVDTTQTFDDFELLFQALRNAFDPTLGGEDLRNSFKMVHAKAPRDEKDLKGFRERSWDIWTKYLYDDDSNTSKTYDSAFTFDLPDEDAPHFPLEITGDDSYSRFDPRTDTYSLNPNAYKPVFGQFLNGVHVLLDLQ
jgi:hypothetical protein